MITNETPEEREEFNRVERESKAKQESIRGTKHPTREQLIAELDVAQMLIRELGDRLARLEKPWVGLTDEEAQEAFARHNCTISADLAGILARAIEAKLKKKNT
jgi:hypothetical protein